RLLSRGRERKEKTGPAPATAAPLGRAAADRAPGSPKRKSPGGESPRARKGRSDLDLPGLSSSPPARPPFGRSGRPRRCTAGAGGIVNGTGSPSGPPSRAVRNIRDGPPVVKGHVRPLLRSG